MLEALRDYQVDLLIHGHTHRPAVHNLDHENWTARRIVLGDWYEQGSVLVCTKDGYQLESLGRSGT